MIGQCASYVAKSMLQDFLLQRTNMVNTVVAIVNVDLHCAFSMAYRQRKINMEKKIICIGRKLMRRVYHDMVHIIQKTIHRKSKQLN